MLIPIMMQRDRVKVLKGISNLPSWRRKTRVKRYALHLTCADCETFVRRTAHVDAVALSYVSKVDGVDAAALIGDDGWFAVA